jgi:phage/plasmid-associated DNA primase
VIIYDPSTGLWDNDERALRKALSSAKLIEETPEGTVNYSGYACKQDQIIKILPSHLPKTEFVFRAMKRSIGKFLFTNGIYDAATRTFKEGYDPSLYFCTRINRPFPKERDEAKISHVNRLIFQDPFLESEQELGVYYKKLIARAVAGFYEDKTFVIGVGTPNSGKGVLTTALQQTFGEYIGDFQADSLKIKKYGSQDAAKELSWVQAFWHRRLAISNEAGTDCVYNSQTIKSMCSAGDRITSRMNFQDEKAVVNMATLLMLCNDIPKLHPIDTALVNRLVIIEYKLSFVDNPSLPHERQIDYSVRSLFDSEEYRDAFFWVLMDAFQNEKPARCSLSMASAREWVPAPSTSFKDVLVASGYVIDTKDEEAWVPFSELKEVLLGSEAAKGMSDTAIGKELERLGLVVNLIKKNGKTIRVRKYIKKNEDIHETE